MSNKNNKIIYWVATGLLSIILVMSAGMYIIKNDEIRETFSQLGFPTFIIYPLACLKILGLVAIWTKKSKTLKEWAYAGFFFNFILAFGAHISINDNEYAGAVVAMILLMVSYVYDRKIA